MEARAQALELMEKVGIPNAEQRFDDYPFQYSGGMMTAYRYRDCTFLPSEDPHLR